MHPVSHCALYFVFALLQDNRAIDAAEASLHNAQADVARAKEHVDELQNKIDDLKRKIDNLPWYLKWEAVGYGTELAAIWVAKETADGVLSLANLALEAAEKAISLPIVPDLDPRILALEAAHGVAHAALDAAQAIIMAAEDVYNGIMDIVEKAAIWQGKLLNIELLELSGSLAMLKSGDLVHIRVKVSH